MRREDGTSNRIGGLAAVLLLLGTALYGALLAVPETAEAGHHVSPPGAGGMWLLTTHDGADKNPGAAADDRTFTVAFRNPYAQGEPDLNIWQLFVAVDQAYGITFDADNSGIFIDGRAQQEWIVNTVNDCGGERGLLLNSPGTIAPPNPTGTCHSIYFTAPHGTGVPPSGIAELRIRVAFDDDVHDPPYCAKIPMHVVGLHERQDPATDTFHFTAPPGLFHLVVDDGSPPVVVDRGQEHDEPLIYITDEDHNGRIDTAYIQFNKELDPFTLDVSDFRIGRQNEYFVIKADIIDPVNADGSTPIAGAGEGGAPEFCPENSMVRVKFQEGRVYDTGGDRNGDMPDVRYTRKPVGARADPHVHNVLTGLAGVRVANTGAIDGVADRAAAVLVAVNTELYRGDDPFVPQFRVLLAFSEPVGLCSDPENHPVTEENLRWRPDQAVPPEGLPLSSDAVVVHHDPSPPQGRNDRDLAARMWVVFEPQGTYGIGEDGISNMKVEYTFVRDGVSRVAQLNPDPFRFWPDPKANPPEPEDRICDRSGNEAHIPAGTEEEPRRAVAEPSIISVDGNIGFNKVTVRFTGPVNMTAAGRADPTGIFTVVGGGTGSPSGVTAVDHVDGADWLVVTLNAPLTEGDVSGDPIRMANLRMVGGMFEISYSEWRNPDPSQDKSWKTLVQDVPIIDVTPPRPQHALTRDLDGNGKVDAIEFIFSEPILSTSFRQGHPGAPGVSLNVEDHNNYRRVDDEALDGNRILVRMSPNDPARAWDTHRIPRVSAMQVMTTAGELRGMVTDRAVNPESSESNLPGNWMEDMTEREFQRILRDGALPRVMQSWTLDLDGNGLIDALSLTFSEPVLDSTFDANHWIIEREGHTYPVLGLIQHPEHNPFTNDNLWLLELEERDLDVRDPVGDTGPPMPRITYDRPTGQGAGVQDAALLDESLGGPNRMLRFGPDKVNVQDQARPVLMGALGCLGMTTLALVFSEGVHVIEQPGSPPRGLLERDFVYDNRNEGGSDGLEAGTERHDQGDRTMIVQVGRPFTEADLGPNGDRVAVVQDPTLAPDQEGLVKEQTGDLRVEPAPVAWRTLSPAVDIIPPDRVEDLLLIDGSVTAASVELEWTVPFDDGCLERGVAGYVIAFNTTPFGNEAFGRAQKANPALVEYTWYDPVRERNVTTADPLVLLDEHGVMEGETVRARVAGFLPSTEYHLSIKAVDREGNVAREMSNRVQFTTDEDVTPPVLPAEWGFRSPTHPSPGHASKERFPAFEWDAAIDPESVFVTYRYQVSQSSEPPELRDTLPEILATNVSFDMQRVAAFTARPTGLAPPNWYDEPAEWHFHLLACSAGGCKHAKSYPFKVEPQIDRHDMKAVNDEVDTKVTYQEEHNAVLVEWTLPEGWGRDPPSGLPEGCRPGGIQVWYSDPDQPGFSLLGTHGRDSQAYREGFVTDTREDASEHSKYLVTFYCRDVPVTFHDGEGLRQDVLREPGRFPDEGPAPWTDQYEGRSAVVEPAPFRIPFWVVIALAILGLLILAGVVLFFVLRRSGETELWEEGELDEQQALESEEEDAEDGGEPSMGDPAAKGAARPGEAGSAAAAAAAATGGAAAQGKPQGGKVHKIKCPGCASQFEAQGDFPLKVTCPKCGVSGTLGG